MKTQELNRIFEEKLQEKETQKTISITTRKYKLSKEEKYQCGCLGLYRALKTFKKEKSSFNTYLINNIRWCCLNQINENSIKNSVSIETVDPPSTNCSFEWIKIKQVLTEAEADLMESRFLYMKTYSEIGEEHGVTREMIRKRIKKIKAKIRRVY